MYVGLEIHAKTRKKELVDKCFELGLSVSYDSVLAVSTDVANKVCSYYRNLGFVCPPKLKMGLLVHGAADNLDHNPSATTAHGSFHGTSISLFQQPSNDKPGTPQEIPEEEMQTVQKLLELQVQYKETNSAKLPNIAGPVQPVRTNEIDDAIEEEKW